MFDAFRARLRGLVRSHRIDDDIEAEVREHLDRATEQLIARGLPPDEARLAARRQFGNAPAIRETAHDATGLRWLGDLRQDLRYGARGLVRSPGFTAVVMVTLALGFGVNSALFSLLKSAVNLSTVPHGETWVLIPDLWSYREYTDIRARMRTLTHVTAQADESVALLGDTPQQEPEAIRAQFVSDNYFAALDGRPWLGRGFAPDEAAPPGAPVVVLSHRFWIRRFAADSALVGRAIRLADGQAFTVIGIMPREFVGTNIHTPDVWLPLGARGRLPGIGNRIAAAGDNTWFGSGGWEWLWVNGRLADGRTLDAVRAELLLNLDRAVNADTARARAVVRGVHTADGGGINSADERTVAAIMLGAGMSVLLIASATVANLMLARSAARRRETGIRLSLGARRGRVVRQLVTESLLLALGGAAIGVLLATWTARSLTLSGSLGAIIEDADPILMARFFSPDVSVIVYMLILAVISTSTFGLVPALRSTRVDPLVTIREGGGGNTGRLQRVRLRSGLVVVQVGLTMVLLVTSGLLVRGLLHAMTIDPGFDRKDVLAVSPRLTMSGYDSLRTRLFLDDFVARLPAVPGVRLVTRGNVPIENIAPGWITRPGVDPPPSPDRRSNGFYNAVSETFFDALGIGIIRGRAFSAAEVRAQAPVVVVSETAARTLWPGEEPLNQVVAVRPTVRGVPGLPAEGQFEMARVIGVAKDAQMNRLGFVNRLYAYVPGDYWTVMVRRSPGDDQVAGRVMALARQIDPSVVVHVRSLEEVIWRSTGPLQGARMTSIFAAALGALSLIMAAVGLFGLTAYSVAQRTREFGVRMALGARGGDVLRQVVRESLWLVAAGALLGVAGGASMSGVLRAVLFGVSTLDPLAYVAVVALLLLVTTAACYVPARRATRVDPVVALRAD
jgi:predicted permease